MRNIEKMEITLTTHTQWKTVINNVLPIYKLIYASQNCPIQFNKIWANWVDSEGITV